MSGIFNAMLKPYKTLFQSHSMTLTDLLCFVSGDKGKIFTGLDNNISVDPMFVSAYDLRLTSSTPRPIRTGALNLSADPDFVLNSFGQALDLDGNIRTEPWSMGAFENDETGDITPPVISNVATSDITKTGVTITWLTDENSTSQVAYGTSTAYGSITTLENTLTNNHSVVIANLSAATTYHFCVKSKDIHENEKTSADFTFVTAAPVPASATMPTNSITNTGNGICSAVAANGSEIKDESIQILFDGADPIFATSYNVTGSVRGLIGAGTLGGTQVRIQGDPVGFGTSWTPAMDTFFDISDNQFAPPRTATVSFAGGSTFALTDITDAINTAMLNNGVFATAFYDAASQSFYITSVDEGSNRELEVLNETGDFADLNLPVGVFTATGGARPEVFNDSATAQANSTEWDSENDRWDPASDVSLTITDREGRTALVNFSDIVLGSNQIYTRSAILAEINNALNTQGISATSSFVDSNNNGISDQLLIAGNYPGYGERLIISGTGYEQLGLTAGETRGTARTSFFSQGGIEFTLTEGDIHWVPGDSISFETTAEK